MRRCVVRLAITAVLTSWLVAAPAGAISPLFFQSYVSAGALVIRTGYPVGGSALISVNFNPADFAPAEADALYQGLRGVLVGATIDSFGPADIAVAGLSPVQAIQALQQFYLSPASGDFREFYLLNVYRRPPSGIAIDLYRFFGPNDFRFTITYQG